MAIIQIPVVTDYILIVDDDVPITRFLKNILSEEGEIHVAHDGEEGLSCVMKQDYDLIVSDIDMPQKDGLSFYVDATEKKPHLKGRFLFITGTISDMRLAFFQKHGIEYLIKPSSVKDIRITAKRILLLTKTSKEQD